MKEIYTGYTKKTDTELKALWSSALISFDANVLLNLYRYSSDTRKQIINLLSKFSSRIFLTHQAGLEFHRNRFDIITDQEKVYKDFFASIEKLDSELNSKNKHPFLAPSLQVKVNETLNSIKEDILSSEKYYRDLLNKDDIYSELEKSFTSKIASPYDTEKLKQYHEDAKVRFLNKIPPGYMDEKDKEIPRKYGDYILWKQLIDHAKRKQKPLLFITDEKKEDWWWKLKNGKTIGPRQELVEEFKNETSMEFHIYSTDKFIEFGLSFFNETNPQAVLEVKVAGEERVRELEQHFRRKERLDKLKETVNDEEIFRLKQELDLIDNIDTLHNKKRSLLTELLLLERKVEMTEGDLRNHNSIHNLIAEIENEMEQAKAKLLNRN